MVKKTNCKLEGEWRAIAMQTAWKLEPVYYYEENTISDADNSQTAAGDQVTILSAEDNEHSNLMATVSNHNQSNAPLAAPTPLAPLDATPLHTVQNQ